MKAWTQAHMAWVKSAVHFEHAAHEATLLDYIHEVEHVAARIGRLESAIDAAVQHAPIRLRAVIEALQALRGIALVTAVTIAAEVGECSRFTRPWDNLSPPDQMRTGNAVTVVVERHTEWRILDEIYAARPALLVRGSSRRITIMRFRPANIRVIHRRDSQLGHLRASALESPIR